MNQLLPLHWPSIELAWPTWLTDHVASATGIVAFLFALVAFGKQLFDSRKNIKLQQQITAEMKQNADLVKQNSYEQQKLTAALNDLVARVEQEQKRSEERQALLANTLQSLADQSSVNQKELSEHVRKIQNSVSTQFVGQFPAHLSDIVSLIPTAKNYVWAYMDCVDYGSFSDPEQHNQLYEAITQLTLATRPAGRIPVTFLILERPQELSAASALNLTDKWEVGSFNLWVNKFLRGLDSFQEGFIRERKKEVDSIRQLANTASLDWRLEDNKKRLLSLLSAFHRWQIKNYRHAHHVEVVIPWDDFPEASRATRAERRKSSANNLYFWIIDDVAIMLLTCPGMDAFAFVTRDEDYISRLQAIFLDKAKSVEKLYPGLAQRLGAQR